MDKTKNIQNIYPLSRMQEGMLFHSFLQKEGAAYIEQSVFTIKGRLRPELFEQSVQSVISRHDIFRTVFLPHVAQLNGPAKSCCVSGNSGCTAKILHIWMKRNRAPTYSDLRNVTA